MSDRFRLIKTLASSTIKKHQKVNYIYIYTNKTFCPHSHIVNYLIKNNQYLKKIVFPFFKLYNLR